MQVTDRVVNNDYDGGELQFNYIPFGNAFYNPVAECPKGDNSQVPEKWTPTAVGGKSD